jgi:prepilin-type N-terminal cleavage/methylation domain-containing protein
MTPASPRKAGFTLIELMIVVAIIGILAAIAIPKFAELIRKSGEGASKGNLGSLRSAMTIYYGDMEGVYPSNPAALTIAGKYLSTVPNAKTPNYHADSSGIVLGNQATGITDLGGWIYDSLNSDPQYGNLFVNCSHTDSKGSQWESY